MYMYRIIYLPILNLINLGGGYVQCFINILKIMVLVFNCVVSYVLIHVYYYM